MLNIKWIGTDGDFYPGRVDDATGRAYKPVAIICHIMEGTLAGTDQTFNDPKRNASTHFGIGKNGEIHQYVKLEDGAWGNGLISKPTWGMIPQFPGVNPNLWTISIEFEGLHPDMDHGKFYTFTDAQYIAGGRLIAQLCQQFGIPCDRLHIAGHSEIDSTSKWFCPGPTFDFNRIISEANAILAPKEDTPVLKKEDADSLIKLLGSLWFLVKGQEAQDELHRLANELRIASGQEVEN